MALTSNDETDLLLPLYGGIRETPRFATFLARLARRTGAQHVSLALRGDSAALAGARVWFAGPDLRHPVREADASATETLDPAMLAQLRPYRVYGISDFADHDPALRERLFARLEPLGILDQRFVRIPLDDDASGWLTLARDRPCSASDSALLSSLAPYVAAALKTSQALERVRLASAVSAEALTRSGTGWILFDAEARVVAVEPAIARAIARITGSLPIPGERLRALPPAAQRQLSAHAARLAEDGHEAGSAVLWEEPRVDALLAPFARADGDALAYADAVMVAWCRFSDEDTRHDPGALAGLFDLPRREAQLALALAEGHSIAEAAADMGLTLETARNYSKRIYAKTGARGQPELVRMIHRSSALLG